MKTSSVGPVLSRIPSCCGSDRALVADTDAWQSLWFELEIVNGLALAEWDEQGRPVHGLASWRENYQQEARSLATELLALILPDTNREAH